MKCKKCGKEGDHYCELEGRYLEEESDGSFFLSMAIGAATDSALLGGILGGDLVGGIIGDALDGDLFD